MTIQVCGGRRRALWVVRAEGDLPANPMKLEARVKKARKQMTIPIMLG